MSVSVEIVVVCFKRACFRGNSRNTLKFYEFQMKQLKLAQSVRVSLETVAIGSDYARFS